MKISVGLRSSRIARGRLLSSRSIVEFAFDPLEIAAAVSGQISSFRKVLTQKPVGIFIGSALPRAASVTEVDRGAGGCGYVALPEMECRYGWRISAPGGRVGELRRAPVGRGCRCLRRIRAYRGALCLTLLRLLLLLLPTRSSAPWSWG